MDYKEKLEEAKRLYETANADQRYVLESLFPELKESEDEMIRKELIEFVDTNTLSVDARHDRWLAWLEKQGEKLPVGFYYVNSEGKKFYSDTFKYGNVTLHVEKQGERKHKFIIGDIISNGNVIYRVDNIVKNCIGQDCYFLVNVESEKDGTRYYKLTNSEGKTYNSGEITWLCEQVDKSFEKQGEQKPDWSEDGTKNV